MAKITKSAAEISQKWNRNTKNGVQDAIAGVDRVTEAPGAKAAAKADKMLKNLQESVQSGRWGKAVGGVSLSDWKEKTKTKMASRMASGVDGAMSKRQAFDTWLVPQIEAAQNKIDNMPDLTLEDNLNRMTTFVRSMASKKYKGQ